MYCKEHKIKGMILVNLRSCEEPGCKIRPTFSYIGENKKIFCKKHKKDGMNKKYHKMCEEPDCTIQASYSF
jgi:hypothetical protein